MSSGTEIIESALQEIGAQSIGASAPPQAIEDGMKRLNRMLQTWISWEINIPVNPLSAPGDELGEPSDTTNAIIDNLALQLAPFYDNGNNKKVSQDLKNNARSGLADVKQLYRTLIVPCRQISSTTPRGQGNYIGVNSRVFFGRGEPLSG